MIATGQPVQEIEEELAEVGIQLGYPDIQTAVGPTGLIVTLSEGGPATQRSAPAGLASTSPRASVASATSWSGASSRPAPPANSSPRWRVVRCGTRCGWSPWLGPRLPSVSR